MCIASNGHRKCYSCHKTMPISEFTKAKHTTDGLDYYCKKCKKDKNSKYYQDKYKSIKRERVRQRKLELLTQKQLQQDIVKHKIIDTKAKGCVVCGELEVCCLDFHHIDPSQKKFEISQYLRGSATYTFEEVISEISKCVVVCANCHRKIHAGLIPCPAQNIPLAANSS